MKNGEIKDKYLRAEYDDIHKGNFAPGCHPLYDYRLNLPATVLRKHKVTSLSEYEQFSKLVAGKAIYNLPEIYQYAHKKGGMGNGKAIVHIDHLLIETEQQPNIVTSLEQLRSEKELRAIKHINYADYAQRILLPYEDLHALGFEDIRKHVKEGILKPNTNEFLDGRYFRFENLWVIRKEANNPAYQQNIESLAARVFGHSMKKYARDRMMKHAKTLRIAKKLSLSRKARDAVVMDAVETSSLV
jgi:hypothetical protein